MVSSPVIGCWANEIFDDHPKMMGQIIRSDLHDNIGLLPVVGMQVKGHLGTFKGKSSCVMATKIFDDQCRLTGIFLDRINMINMILISCSARQ